MPPAPRTAHSSPASSLQLANLCALISSFFRFCNWMTIPPFNVFIFFPHISLSSRSWFTILQDLNCIPDHKSTTI
ncbi:hypothetical protein GLYMA_05G235100v4 [Glycine max]|uniref:Uncharacterized protein n=1 Tax=Glycine max TaxID=3847 RepID=K7KRK5_SOYBN|nr:hypothetical protein GYH30_013594 [Glycine max]KRH60353.1 hypothetical protein GLYMA_05G235100v4 [Glycine max]